jgi:cellulose synthase/poly-beta-1,6-N-acetylglucosamine synthase-like glycosyltransferase
LAQKGEKMSDSVEILGFIFRDSRLKDRNTEKGTIFGFALSIFTVLFSLLAFFLGFSSVFLLVLFNFGIILSVIFFISLVNNHLE